MGTGWCEGDMDKGDKGDTDESPAGTGGWAQSGGRLKQGWGAPHPAKEKVCNLGSAG